MSFFDRVPDQLQLLEVHFIVCVVGTIELTREQMRLDLPKNIIFHIIFLNSAESLLFDVEVFGMVVENGLEEAVVILLASILLRKASLYGNFRADIILRSHQELLCV